MPETVAGKISGMITEVHFLNAVAPQISAASSMEMYVCSTPVVVCFIKNLVNLAMSTTGGVGELCNFLMGVTFVVPAGLVYKFRKDRVGAVLGSLVGAVVMAVLSLPINLFISYPAYAVFYGMTTDKVMDMYQVILPWVETLPQALLVFNMPFTFCKALCSVIITFVIYKRISPIIKGKSLA